MRQIYLDHNSTTRPHPEVRAAVAAALDVGFGNPSSPHGPGREARDLVERARGQVAALVGARPEEIVFTSGGTESDNLAVRGAATAARARSGRSVVVSAPIEHPAVLGSLEALRAEGFTVRLAPVDGEGRIHPAGVAALVGQDTALLTLALANHELGTLQPVAELARIAAAAGALFHCDAVQAAGKVPVDVGALGIDLLSISSHKLHGPKGAGALWVRRGLDLPALLAGGHQEKERRPGTENVPGIAGFGVACELARKHLPAMGERVAALRDRFEAAALAVEGSCRFGAPAPRVPNTTNLGFAGVEGELLMISLDLEGVAISTGAACTSGSIDPSPVLLALGVGRERALTAARFSLGIDTTGDEIDAAAALLPSLVARIRAAGA